ARGALFNHSLPSKKGVPVVHKPEGARAVGDADPRLAVRAFAPPAGRLACTFPERRVAEGSCVESLRSALDRHPCVTYDGWRSSGDLLCGSSYLLWAD